jgi:predicted NAD/FAD-dependent oxidoreductase
MFQLATDDGPMTFDAAIIAIGPHQFDSISLPADCNPTVPFGYEPIVTIYLKFNERVRLPLPMLGQIEGIVQWFFDRRQLAPIAASGTQEDGLIAAVISSSGPHETFSQEKLAAHALEELARHTGPLPQLAWHKVIAEKFATFACTVPIQSRRSSCQTSTPGLFLAGDYTSGPYPATLEGAVRSGVCAADLVVDFLSTLTP